MTSQGGSTRSNIIEMHGNLSTIWRRTKHLVRLSILNILRELSTSWPPKMQFFRAMPAHRPFGQWLQGMLGGVKAHYDCIKAFSETDFTED